jgi:hypothetical protein
MLYSFDFTIPANTTEASPTVSYEKLIIGEIKKVIMQIPAGHSGLTHIKVFDGETQLYPANNQKDITGDDIIIEFDENYKLESPSTLKFIGWNDDTLYSHSIYTHIVIFPKKQNGEISTNKSDIQIAQNNIKKSDVFDWLRDVLT